MSKPDFVYVIYIDTTPERLWQALADPEMTKDYWGRRRNRSDWKPGSTSRHENYDDSSDVAVSGTVVENVPARRLVLTWSSGNDAGGAASRVSFDIDEFMGSVRLTVTHTDLTPEALRSIGTGWPAVLSILKIMLETGASLPMTRQLWKSATK
jgi:uncharacterized protein YndB with AHSA1/START domain